MWRWEYGWLWDLKEDNPLLFRRIFAYFIDAKIAEAICYILIAKVVTPFAYQHNTFQWGNYGKAVNITDLGIEVQNNSIMMSVLVILVYYGLLTWSPLRGTIGKLIMGIMVVNQDEERISFFQSMLRAFTGLGFYLILSPLLHGFVSAGYLIVSFIVMFQTRNNEAIHDLLAKTKVIIRG